MVKRFPNNSIIKSMNTTKLRKTDYLFLFIVLIGFYILYRFSLFTLDDYYYSFIGVWSDGVNGEYEPVNSLGDAIKSNIYDYIHWNGRFIIHTITSYFCGVLGVDIFRILNSIIFSLLIAGLIKLIRSEFGYNKTDKYIILFLLIIFMPIPGYIFLGHIAGVTNYLWTSCAIVYFIILYNKTKENNDYNVCICILLLLTGIIIGSLQESFTIGISGALFIYYCYNIKKFRGSVVWLVIGFWIGTCIVTFAPGNFLRLLDSTSTNSSSVLIKHVSQFAHLFFDSKLLPILTLSTIVLYIKNKHFIIEFLKMNMFYILAILFNSIIIIVVYTDKRQLTSIELFSMILLIKIIYSKLFVFFNNKSLIINYIIMIILAFLYIPIYKNRKINYNKHIEIQSLEPKNGIIIYKNFIDNINNNVIISNYTFYTLEDFNTTLGKTGISLLKTNGKDINYINGVLPISPEEIDKQFKDNESKYKFDKKNQSYYFRCNKDKCIEHISMYTNPTTCFGQIRNLILKKQYNKINISNNLVRFKYSNYNYYVFIDFKGLKIHDFEIEYK